MGFYFRKSVNLGPFRLNFSKSGVGVSTGVKGFRYSVGPRGAFIQMGRNGFYYRKKVSTAYHQQHFVEPIDQALIEPDNQAGVIDTADASELVDSSSQELLAEINSNLSKTAFAPIIAWCAMAIACLTVLLPTSFTWIFGGVILVVGLIYAVIIDKDDRLRRTTPLFYELHDEAAVRFVTLQQACARLGQAQCIWRIKTQHRLLDQKRNAGANSEVGRCKSLVGKLNPPYLSSNLEIYGIDTNAFKLFFFPDHILVFQDGKYGAISYGLLDISFGLERFIENNQVPRDAQIVDYTWQYVNRNGGPDKRFNNNRQIPVVLYGLVQLTSTTGLNLYLHVSNPELAEEFAETFERIKSHQFQEEPKRQESKPKQEASNITLAYETLGLSPGASEVEITAAYHKMACLYHPDKVANLASEFRDLAERRMKEINEAYSQLKQIALNAGATRQFS